MKTQKLLRDSDFKQGKHRNKVFYVEATNIDYTADIEYSTVILNSQTTLNTLPPRKSGNLSNCMLLFTGSNSMEQIMDDDRVRELDLKNQMLLRSLLVKEGE